MSKTETHSLLNFFAPTELIGTSGQPSPAQLEDVARSGYTTVVNLAMNDSNPAVAEEGHLVSGLGMDYIHLPIPFNAPETKHLRRFCQIMDVLAEDKVLVHCAVNARVSVFIYKYLTLRRGYSDDAATSPLLAEWRSQIESGQYSQWQVILDAPEEALE